MSKFAVEAFSDGLRYEMKPFGISVHLIEPGMVKTNILNPDHISKGLENTYDKIDDNMKEEYGNQFLKTRKFSFYKTCKQSLFQKNIPFKSRTKIPVPA